jgi:hypothetical protein
MATVADKPSPAAAWVADIEEMRQQMKDGLKHKSAADRKNVLANVK